MLLSFQNDWRDQPRQKRIQTCELTQTELILSEIQGRSLSISHLFWHQLLSGVCIGKEANARKDHSIWSPRASISSAWLDDFPHLLHSNVPCQLPVFPQYFLCRVSAVGRDQTQERGSETPFSMLPASISVPLVWTWPMNPRSIIQQPTSLLQLNISWYVIFKINLLG